MRPETGHLLA